MARPSALPTPAMASHPRRAGKAKTAAGNSDLAAASLGYGGQVGRGHALPAGPAENWFGLESAFAGCCQQIAETHADRAPDRDRGPDAGLSRASAAQLGIVFLPLTFRLHAAASMRWRSRSKPARPYICRLTSLSCVIRPSTGPVLHDGKCTLATDGERIRAEEGVPPSSSARYGSDRDTHASWLTAAGSPDPLDMPIPNPPARAASAKPSAAAMLKPDRCRRWSSASRSRHSSFRACCSCSSAISAILACRSRSSSAVT